jgi:hypothetical protein
MKESKIGPMLAQASVMLLAALGFSFRATADEQSLAVSLRLPSEVFSQHGPVDAVLAIQNHSQGKVKLDLGLNHKVALVIVIHRPDGSVVKPPYPELADGMGAPGDVALAPGRSYEEILVLNDWEGFDQPGGYEVEVDLPPVQEPAWLRSEHLRASARFRVVRRDPAMLAATCKRLQEATMGKDVWEVSHALAFAADEACLSSLAAVLRTSFLAKDKAIQGLARLGSPAAVAVVVSAWDALDPHFKETARVEFSHVHKLDTLREALRKAGKKAGPP